MNKIPAAIHLSQAAYKQFLQTYSNHNSSLPFDKCATYDLAFVVKVQQLKNGDLLVHYENGTKFLYTKKCEWIPLEEV